MLKPRQCYDHIIDSKSKNESSAFTIRKSPPISHPSSPEEPGRSSGGVDLLDYSYIFKEKNKYIKEKRGCLKSC